MGIGFRGRAEWGEVCPTVPDVRQDPGCQTGVAVHSAFSSHFSLLTSRVSLVQASVLNCCKNVLSVEYPFEFVSNILKICPQISDQKPDLIKCSRKFRVTSSLLTSSETSTTRLWFWKKLGCCHVVKFVEKVLWSDLCLVLQVRGC